MNQRPMSVNRTHTPDVSRLIRIASALIVLVAAAGAAAHALALPLFSSADEIGQFDYAYQVWHGQLPDFYEGVVVDQFKGSSIPVQWVSQHPPLFYALLAPVVGPLTDSGRILVAGMLARAVNVCIGSAGIAAIMWASRQAYPRFTLLWLTAGLVGALSPWLRGTSGAIYNDTLAILICALLLGLTARMLRNGHTRATWIGIILLSGAAFLTRLSLMVVVAACLGALSLERLLATGAPTAERLRGIFGSLCAGVVILASSGWFYLRNLSLTGSITGGHPEWSQEHLGRVTRSLVEVIVDGSTWPRLLGIFGTQATGWTWAFFGLVVAPIVIGVVSTCLPANRRHWTAHGLWITGALLTSLALAVLMQLQYATGGGGIMPRYMLPVLLPLAVFIAAGLSLRPFMVKFLLPLWSLGAGSVLVRWWITLPTYGEGHFPVYLELALPMMITSLIASAGAIGVLIVITRRLDADHWAAAHTGSVR